MPHSVLWLWLQAKLLSLLWHVARPWLTKLRNGSIKTALNVLERCLHTLSELTFSISDSIPEELYELWAFSAEWLALSIPTFDDFDLKKIELFLINDEGIDSPSPELIRDVGEYWLWWVTWEIERAVLRWVQHGLMKTRELILISDFLYMVELYWQRLEPDLASSLLPPSPVRYPFAPSPQTSPAPFCAPTYQCQNHGM